MHEGSVFTGKHATLWDLSDEHLRSRLLGPRAGGGEVWIDGQPFKWESSVLRIYEGPPTEEIPDFTPILGPGAYAATSVLQEATDRYITGPPATPALPARPVRVNPHRAGCRSSLSTVPMWPGGRR